MRTPSSWPNHLWRFHILISSPWASNIQIIVRKNASYIINMKYWHLLSLYCSFYHIFFLFTDLFIYLFIFVVNFIIHWKEKALGPHVFPIPIPPPTSLPTRSLQVLPEHQVRALVSCIQPGPVICFTLDSIHVSTLFSWNIPPLPSPTESKRLFCKSVSLSLFCI